jgi:hypothetical protein
MSYKEELQGKTFFQKFEYIILNIICMSYIASIPLFYGIAIISSPGWNHVFNGKLMGLSMAVYLIISPFMFNFIIICMKIASELSKNHVLSLPFMKSTLGMDISTMTAVSNVGINCVGACVTSLFFVYSMIALNNPPSTLLFVIFMAKFYIITFTLIYIIFVIDFVITHISINPLIQSQTQ